MTSTNLTALRQRIEFARAGGVPDALIFAALVAEFRDRAAVRKEMGLG